MLAWADGQLGKHGVEMNGEVSVTDSAIVAIGVAGTDRCIRPPEAAEVLRLDDVARPSLGAMFRSASIRAYSESDNGSAPANRSAALFQPPTADSDAYRRATSDRSGSGAKLSIAPTIATSAKSRAYSRLESAGGGSARNR